MKYRVTMTFLVSDLQEVPEDVDQLVRLARRLLRPDLLPLREGFEDPTNGSVMVLKACVEQEERLRPATLPLHDVLERIAKKHVLN